MTNPDRPKEEASFERPKEDWFACIVVAEVEKLNKLPDGKENIALENFGIATTKILRSEVDMEESFIRIMEAFFDNNKPYVVINWVDEEGLAEHDRKFEEGLARLRAKFAGFAKSATGDDKE